MRGSAKYVYFATVEALAVVFIAARRLCLGGDRLLQAVNGAIATKAGGNNVVVGVSDGNDRENAGL